MTETTPQTPEPVEVHVLGADMAEAARLLLDAAADLGHAPEVVETIGGGFVVPRDVAEKAGALDAEIDQHPEPSEDAEQLEGERTPFAGGPSTPTATTAADPDDVDPADTPAGPPTDGVAEQPVDLTTEGEAATTATAAEGTKDQTEQAEVLRGDALDQALKDRDLPTSGTADEKRARVAEHDAAQQ
jgi:hypothetical protein